MYVKIRIEKHYLSAMLQIDLVNREKMEYDYGNTNKRSAFNMESGK